MLRGELMRAIVQIALVAVCLALVALSREVLVQTSYSTSSAAAEVFGTASVDPGNSQRLSALEARMAALEATLRQHLLPAATPVAASSPPSAAPPPPSASPSFAPPPPPKSAAVDFGAANAFCNPTPHAGYGGGSLGWGMSFKVATAQECCDACKAHAQTCIGEDAKGKTYYQRSWQGSVTAEKCPATMSSNEDGTHKAAPCNIFTFCPTPPSEGGLCWSNDVWNVRAHGRAREASPHGGARVDACP